MKDNNSIFSINTNPSIRTNYNNYKRIIRRVNSKPNISRTREFFNNEINKISNNKTQYNINYNYNNQNYNNSNYNIPNGQNHSNYYPSEEISGPYQKNTYEYNKNKLYPNTKRVIDINYQEPPKIQKHINNDNTPRMIGRRCCITPQIISNPKKEYQTQKHFKVMFFQMKMNQ
jgi:DNA-binding transcriptional regulator GbsR (MarR family)